MLFSDDTRFSHGAAMYSMRQKRRGKGRWASKGKTVRERAPQQVRTVPPPPSPPSLSHSLSLSLLSLSALSQTSTAGYLHIIAIPQVLNLWHCVVHFTPAQLHPRSLTPPRPSTQN